MYASSCRTVLKLIVGLLLAAGAVYRRDLHCRRHSIDARHHDPLTRSYGFLSLTDLPSHCQNRPQARTTLGADF